MITPQKYQDLKSAIQKVCPEISYICECPRCKSSGMEPEHSDVEDGVACRECGGSGDYRVSRKIQISDVLRTIGNSSKDTAVNYGINANGCLQYGVSELRGCFDENDEPIYWDFAHDDLDWHYKNLPNTCEWLHSVICTPNNS